MTSENISARRLLLSTSLLVSISILPGHQAHAQSTDSEERELDTIVVTSERRVENLQDKALSISAVSAEDITQANIVDIAGLNGYVPGLLTSKSSGSEMMISVRGVGSETPQNIYTQPGVSVFVDGLYVPTALGVSQGFLDLDRIEVLRGPQGALFGQSSTGGAISIVSKAPVLGELSGMVEAAYGTYDLNKEAFAVNLPLSDTVALRAAFQHSEHDGFGRNTFYPRYDLDDANESNSKVSLLWKPTDRFSLNLTARYYDEDHNGALQKNILDPDPNPRQVSQDLGAALSLQYQMYSATMTYDLPFMTIKSVTGYQDMVHDQKIDNDRLSADIFGRYDAQAKWESTSQTWTEEINLISKPGGFVDWIAGLFYLNSDTDQYIVEFRNIGTQPTFFDIPPVTGPEPANLGYEEYSVITRESWAPFIQATLNMTDDFRILGGARYNHDSYEGAASFNYSPLDDVPSYSKGTWTGKAGVEFDAAESSMLYASWTRGYKPGGINNAYDGTAVIVEQEFETETVDSYEIGAKSEFFDRTLRLNVAGFYSAYNNMQYLSSDPVMWQDGTANIPKSKIWGAEFEGSWIGVDGRLRVDGNLTLLDGEFEGEYYVLDAQSAAVARRDFLAANPGLSEYDQATVDYVSTQTGNIDGNKPAKLPGVTGSIRAGYSMDFVGGVLTPKLEYVYRGDHIYRVFNSAELDQVDSYDVVNFYLDYEPPIEGLHLILSATNLGDKDAIAGRFTDPYGSGQTSNQFIAPRQVVLTARYSF